MLRYKDEIINQLETEKFECCEQIIYLRNENNKLKEHVKNLDQKYSDYYNLDKVVL